MTSPATPEFLLTVCLHVYIIVGVVNDFLDFSNIFISEVLINDNVSLKDKQEAIQDYKVVSIAWQT